MQIIAKEFTFPDRGMLCGSYEAEIRTFKKFVDATGNVWLVAIQEAAGENIYFHRVNDKKSEGFGGRTLTFKLEDGTEYAAQGPWHSNAQALFEKTGYDVRDRFFTQGAVGYQRSPDANTILDVLYMETEPILGTYGRVEAIAQKIADEVDMPVQYMMRSRGGGTTCPVKPASWSQERYHEFWKKK